MCCRIAKDKLSGAKEWVDETADARGGVNFRGAGAGAVAGGLLLGINHRARSEASQKDQCVGTYLGKVG